VRIKFEVAFKADNITTDKRRLSLDRLVKYPHPPGFLGFVFHSLDINHIDMLALCVLLACGVDDY
jgi:hypothetical protein